ncbi:hypothetical protein L6R52_08300 [Myxococcota bacterium]|nr:hypothetical protein [Myxococcota bacterium]
MIFGLTPSQALGAVLGLAVILGLATLAVAPFVVARRVFVPLGMPRLAVWLSGIPVIASPEDPDGGRALLGAWALLRARGAGDQTIAWIESMLGRARPLRGASIAASALLHAKRSDLDGARALFESLELLDPRVVPKTALEVAREWRAADAAARGAWDELVELAARAPSTRTVHLLGLVARHLVGDEISPRRLWLAWALAPRRTRTFAFVQRALARPRGVAAIDHAPPRISLADDERTAVFAVMRFHAALAARGADDVAPDDLVHLATLWHGALDELGRSDGVVARAAALGVERWEHTLRELARQAQTELTELVRKSSRPLDTLPKDAPELLDRARRTVRSELLTEIELAAEALARRAREGRALPGHDEWREWNEHRQTIERALARGGHDVLRLAQPVVDRGVGAFAVWLYNPRHEHAMGNAIFRWLVSLAERAGDEEAITRGRRNVDCGAL